ncbi:MAG: ABC transporter substrate-binding protein [Bacillota bacterium]
MILKLKKLTILNIIAVMISSLFLTGCSSDSSGSDGGNSDDHTAVTLWHNLVDSELKNLEKTVQAFEEKNPDIKFKMVYTASNESSDEKLLTAIAGGNSPDVAYFDRFKIASWAAQGSLTDLTDMAAESGITEDMYYPSAWEQSHYKGKLFGIPINVGSRLLFYNKDHFKEVGLDPENPPKTISELEVAAEKLTLKDGNRFKRIGFIPWYAQGWLYTWGWAFGGDFYEEETGKVTANDPKIVESLKWMTDFANKYNVEDINGFTNSQGEGGMDPFITGQLSMKVDGNWSVSNIEKFKPDLNYGVTPIPTPTGKDFNTWPGGYAFIIPKGSKRVDEAWRFLEFTGKEEGQRLLNENELYSSMPSVNKSSDYTKDPIQKEFIDALENSHHRPAIPEGQLLWNELVDAVQNSIRGNGTPKVNLDKVTDTVNKALEKYK